MIDINVCSTQNITTLLWKKIYAYFYDLKVHKGLLKRIFNKHYPLRGKTLGNNYVKIKNFFPQKLLR